MRKVFTAVFVVTLVLVLCCPAFGSTNDEVRGTNGNNGGLCPPDMDADSGLTWYQIAGLIAAIGTSTALGWQGHKKMNAIRIEPQPLEVKHRAEYVKKHEFESYKGEVRDSIKGLHARVDNATIAISEMRGKLDKIDDTQQEILKLLLHRHD